MSVSINIIACSGKDSEEFKKHYAAVEFCIENNLSFPKETSEFFKGKVDGEDLEDYNEEFLLDMIKDGVHVPINIDYNRDNYEYRIKVSDIPKEVDYILISYSY